MPFSNVNTSRAIADDVTVLEVSTRVGRVRIVGDAEDTVRVHASVKLERSRARETPDPGEFDDHVTFEIQGQKLVIADAHMGADESSAWQVSLVIHAPPRLAVAVAAGTGEIHVLGMNSDLNLGTRIGGIEVATGRSGAITARVESGPIRLRTQQATGRVQAHSDAGDVSLEIASEPPAGGVKLTSGSGNLLLRLPEYASGAFHAVSKAGTIAVSERKGISVTQVGAGARGEGTVGQGRPTFDLHTDSGRITIR